MHIHFMAAAATAGAPSAGAIFAEARRGDTSLLLSGGADDRLGEVIS